MNHKDLAEWIQRSINEICPYEDESVKRLYFVGFLSSYLASLMMNDSQEFYRFKNKMDKAADKAKRFKKPL